MLRIIFLLLITSASFGQVLQETNGSRAENRIVHKLGFRLPQVCWVTGNPNLLNYSAFMSKGAMVYDTCAGKIKRWSGSAWVSIQDSTAGGSGTVTSVATGLGLTGGTITTSGTVSLDTASSVVLSRQRAANTYALIGAGGGTPGGGTYSIQYNRAGAFAGRSTFVFDTVNARVGIGTASPSTDLNIQTNSTATPYTMASFKNTAANGIALFTINNSDDKNIGVSISGPSYGIPNQAAIGSSGALNSFVISTDGHTAGPGTTPIHFRPGGFNATPVARFSPGGLSLAINDAVNVATLNINGATTGAVNISAAGTNILVNATGSPSSSMLITGANNVLNDIRTTTNTAFSGLRVMNNRTFGTSMLGLYHFGSTNALTLFGQTAADWSGVYTQETSSGLQVGSLNNTRVIFGTNNTARAVIEADGDWGFGTITPAASSILDITSTTKGFLRPRQTTGQRDAIASAATGLSIYNTTLSTNDVKTAAAWYQQPNGLTGSATLDFPSTNAHSSSDLTLTVTGAAVGDIVILGTPVQDIDATYTAFVSLANTVTVRFNHYGSGTTNPASGTFKVYVIKN